MRIKKIAQSIGVIGKILNARSTSQTDTYSCNYINKLNEYSDTEQVIGKYIDGKPLYRTFLQGNTNNWSSSIGDSETNINLPFSIDKVIKYYGYITSSANNLDFVQPSSYSRLIKMNNTMVRLDTYVTDLANNSRFNIFIEYTKTTD